MNSKSLEKEFEEIKTYFYKLDPDLASCEKTNAKIGGKSKKKILKGGTPGILKALLCAADTQVHPINLQNQDTRFSDLPIELILEILRQAKLNHESVKDLIDKISLVDKDGSKIKQYLLDFNNKEKQLEIWQLYDQTDNIYSNFIEYVMKHFTNIIDNTSINPVAGPLEILFTQDYKFTNSDGEKNYKIVTKKIIFQKHSINNLINIKIQLGYYDNLEYIDNDNNSQDVSTIVLQRSPNTYYGPLIESINRHNQNINRLTPRISIYNRSISKNMNIDPNKSIFGQVYYKIAIEDSAWGDGFVMNSDIDQIINNDFYIKFPKKNMFQQIGKAFTYFLQIRKELKIDKDYIFDKISETRAINKLFNDTNGMALKRKEEIANKLEVQEPTQEPESEPQEYNFANLFDVYFTKSDIEDIDLYLMKLQAQFEKPPNKTKLTEFIQTKLIEINNTQLTEQERKENKTLNIELKQLRKMNLINTINTETRKESTTDIWHIFS
jgi:hypothetical protein